MFFCFSSLSARLSFPPYLSYPFLLFLIPLILPSLISLSLFFLACSFSLSSYYSYPFVLSHSLFPFSHFETFFLIIISFSVSFILFFFPYECPVTGLGRVVSPFRPRSLSSSSLFSLPFPWG